MEKPLLYNNLINFIVNYSQNNLEYSTRSKFEPTLSPSHYQAQNRSSCLTNKHSICLMELTTDTFIPTIMETGKVCSKNIFMYIYIYAKFFSYSNYLFCRLLWFCIIVLIVGFV